MEWKWHITKLILNLNKVKKKSNKSRLVNRWLRKCQGSNGMFLMMRNNHTRIWIINNDLNNAYTKIYIFKYLSYMEKIIASFPYIFYPSTRKWLQLRKKRTIGFPRTEVLVRWPTTGNTALLTYKCLLQEAQFQPFHVPSSLFIMLSGSLLKNF